MKARHAINGLTHQQNEQLIAAMPPHIRKHLARRSSKGLRYGHKGTLVWRTIPRKYRNEIANIVREFYPKGR